MCTKRYFSISTLLLVVIIPLTGCQLIAKYGHTSTTYSEYYANLQQLSNAELMQESANLQANTVKLSNVMQQQDYKNQIKLLLFYSLPKSPIYNISHANDLLSKMEKDSHNIEFSKLKATEKGFITLLRNQLEQLSLQRSHLLSLQKMQHNKQKQYLKYTQTLIEKVKALEQTITQLKKIDQVIDKRAQ